MSMIEPRSTNSIQQNDVSTSHSIPYQPVGLGCESTLHQQADTSSNGCCCFTWICDAISCIFSTIFEWLGCFEQIDTRTTWLTFLPGDEEKISHLKKSPNVKNLNIHWNIPLSDEALAAVVEKCPNLEKASFYDCKAASDKVCAALAKLSHLTELWAPPNMSDQSFSEICKLPLKDLNIQSCKNLTNAGFKHLSNLVQLKGFNAGLTQIENAHLIVIATLPIETLHLGYCSRIISDTLGTVLLLMKNLKNLDVSFNRITDTVLEQVATLPLETLHVNNLKEREPHKKMVTEDLALLQAMAAFGKAQSLAHDQIADAMIRSPGDKDWEKIAEYKREGQKHKDFDKTIAGMKQFDEEQANLPPDLTTEGFMALSKMKTLVKLNVSSNKWVTDEVLLAYAEMPKLEELRIKDCENVTSAAIDAFKSQKPNIKLIGG